MMEDIRDFINNLKVLYVEDDENARKVFAKFLNKKFKNSVICNDGVEAYLKYMEAKDSVPFDIIISDINMPKMNGIELLEKVRVQNGKIPFIFTTARLESEHMLKAINLHANAYLVKPIDFKKVDLTLETICEEVYYKKSFDIQKKESDEYLSILNEQALVTKTDVEGNFKFLNSLFLEVSGYSQDELLGENISLLRHPDNPSSLYDEIWDTLKSGKSWDGTIKYLAKDKEVFYLNKKTIPIVNRVTKKIEEFVSVSFLVTDEEKHKREHNKKVIEQITSLKKDLARITKEKDELVNSGVSNNNSNQDTFFLQEKVHSQDKKIRSLLSQLETYEKSQLENSKIDLMTKQDKQKQFEEVSKKLNQCKTQLTNQNSEIETLKKIVENRDRQVEQLEERNLKSQRKIDDLIEILDTTQVDKEKFK